MRFSLRSPTRPTRCGTASALLSFVFCETVTLAYGQAKPQQHIVLMEAVAFSPMTLEARIGDTIVWKNRDPFPHNVTADNGQFHACEIAPEQTGKITIDKQGRFPYVCTLHPGMKGVITVK
jgi:plastocyanin